MMITGPRMVESAWAFLHGLAELAKLVWLADIRITGDGKVEFEVVARDGSFRVVLVGEGNDIVGMAEDVAERAYDWVKYATSDEGRQDRGERGTYPINVAGWLKVFQA